MELESPPVVIVAVLFPLLHGSVILAGLTMEMIPFAKNIGIRSETEPTELEATTRGPTACHMIATAVLLNGFAAGWTGLGLRLHVRKGRRFVHVSGQHCIEIFAGLVGVPRDIMTKARHGSTSVTYHDGGIIPAIVQLAAAALGFLAPFKIFHFLESFPQNQGIVPVKYGLGSITLHIAKFERLAAISHRASHSDCFSFSVHLRFDMASDTYETYVDWMPRTCRCKRLSRKCVSGEITATHPTLLGNNR